MLFLIHLIWNCREFWLSNGRRRQECPEFFLSFKHVMEGIASLLKSQHCSRIRIERSYPDKVVVFICVDGDSQLSQYPGLYQPLSTHAGYHRLVVTVTLTQITHCQHHPLDDDCATAQENIKHWIKFHNCNGFLIIFLVGWAGNFGGIGWENRVGYLGIVKLLLSAITSTIANIKWHMHGSLSKNLTQDLSIKS